MADTFCQHRQLHSHRHRPAFQTAHRHSKWHKVGTYGKPLVPVVAIPAPVSATPSGVDEAMPPDAPPVDEPTGEDGLAAPGACAPPVCREQTGNGTHMFSITVSVVALQYRRRHACEGRSRPTDGIRALLACACRIARPGVHAPRAAPPGQLRRCRGSSSTTR
jgi:hypothetical protein